MYYEIKVITERKNGKGELKEVAERYITDCELFAEAEQAALKECPGGEVVAVSRSKVIEIVNGKEEEKPFYKATVIACTVDDKGNDKEQRYYNLVCAADITEANSIMSEHLKQGFDDMRLDAIVKTRIIDLI